jgi:hypothetical protein
MASWLAELDGTRVTVEVPASSANLGAGYDCLGVALAITNRIELEVRAWGRGQIELTVEGEGRNELSEDHDNRFVRGLESSLRAARGELPDEVGWRISMQNDIPLARGLGSSAAHGPAAMVNLLGTGPRRDARLLGVADALRDPAVHIHLYDKRDVFEGRKMGHLTALGATADQALGSADRALAKLRWGNETAQTEDDR